MLAYIYFNVDDYLLTYLYSMLQQRFKLQILNNYVVIQENIIFED